MCTLCENVLCYVRICTKFNFDTSTDTHHLYVSYASPSLRCVSENRRDVYIVSHFVQKHSILYLLMQVHRGQYSYCVFKVSLFDTQNEQRKVYSYTPLAYQIIYANQFNSLLYNAKSEKDDFRFLFQLSKIFQCVEFDMYRYT